MCRTTTYETILTANRSSAPVKITESGLVIREGTHARPQVPQDDKISMSLDVISYQTELSARPGFRFD